ncbi:single-stranded DNA-binding protein 4 isoform X3 [Pogona vitticeps]
MGCSTLLTLCRERSAPLCFWTTNPRFPSIRPSPPKKNFPGFFQCKPVQRLALYVYEYLLHMGAQKSAQSFLSEIHWEKNITLGEPPGFLHSWWCVFWDLYCAAPDRRETCEHSGETKVFHDYSSAATSSPVMASLAPGDGLPPGPLPSGVFQGPPSSQPSRHAQAPLANPGAMMMGPHNQPFMGSRFPGGLRPSLRMPSQPPVGVPGSQPFLPVAMDSAARAHASVGPGPCMTPPRGMMGVVPQSYGGGMRVPPGSLAGMPTLSMGPGIRGPWLNMNPNAGPFSSPSPGSYGGPTGGSGPPDTPLMPSPGDSTNSSENMYVMNSTGPPGSRPSFSMGASPEGPIAMEPHHLNGSLGPAEMDSLPKNSPNRLPPLTNPPGTPRDDDGSGVFAQRDNERVMQPGCSSRAHLMPPLRGS